MKFSGVMDWNR